MVDYLCLSVVPGPTPDDVEAVAPIVPAEKKHPNLWVILGAGVALILVIVAIVYTPDGGTPPPLPVLPQAQPAPPVVGHAPAGPQSGTVSPTLSGESTLSVGGSEGSVNSGED